MIVVVGNRLDHAEVAEALAVEEHVADLHCRRSPHGWPRRRCRRTSVGHGLVVGAGETSWQFAGVTNVPSLICIGWYVLLSSAFWRGDVDHYPARVGGFVVPGVVEDGRGARRRHVKAVAVEVHDLVVVVEVVGRDRPRRVREGRRRSDEGLGVVRRVQARETGCRSKNTSFIGRITPGEGVVLAVALAYGTYVLVGHELLAAPGRACTAVLIGTPLPLRTWHPSHVLLWNGAGASL